MFKLLKHGSLIAGIGTLVGAFANNSKLSPQEKLIAYGSGAGLIGYSLYQHFGKRKHHGRRHKHFSPYHRCEKPKDYVIEGGHELPYDYIWRNDRMQIAQDAGTTMWPEREPYGSYTGIGLEQRGLSGSRIYPYPDSIYEQARARVAVSP